VSAAHPTTRAWLIRANNPSPMTLEGTNTWVLVEPGDPRAVVIDPGPDDAEHRAAILATVIAAGAIDVALILLTHGHADHAEGTAAFAKLTAAPVRAVARGLCRADVPLVNGHLNVSGLQLEVISAPGHTADSVCFVITADAALVTGDTILGKGSAVVAWPDGRLDEYLSTLQKLRALVEERQLHVVLPGHGPAVHDPAALLDAYIRHRDERLAQVRAAAATAATVDDVLHAVYGDVEPALQFAARWSLLAQLDYLRESGVTVPSERAE
jgi:glyoxylase-like metal-dependent hydrolase (beta-lactamase superfamily II)